MEIVLYNCPHCNTRNVIITKDSLCPNCKHLLTDENRQPPEALSDSEIDGKDVNNTETVNNAKVTYERPWDEKPLIKRIPWTMIRNSILFFGVLVLLLSPVVFIFYLYQRSTLSQIHHEQHRKVSGYDIIKAIHWALKFIFFGWLISEIGLITFKASLAVKVLARISIYLYILLGLVLLGVVYLIVEIFSHMGP